MHFIIDLPNVADKNEFVKALMDILPPDDV